MLAAWFSSHGWNMVGFLAMDDTFLVVIDRGA